MIFLRLFWEFFKTGLFAVGGGMATIPFLSEISTKYPEWFTKAELANMIAVAESTPGPIGVNTATYAGFKTAGILGAVTATIGLVLPSLIIIIIIAGMLEKFNSNIYVQNAFKGIRPGVIGLITVAWIEVLKIAVLTLDKFNKTGMIKDIVDLKALLLFIFIFIILRFKKHPIVYIIIGALCGIIFSM